MTKWVLTKWTATEGSALATGICGQVNGVEYKVGVWLIESGNGEYADRQRAPKLSAEYADSLLQTIEAAIRSRIVHSPKEMGSMQFLRWLPGSGIRPLNSTESHFDGKRLAGSVRAEI